MQLTSPCSHVHHINRAHKTSKARRPYRSKPHQTQNSKPTPKPSPMNTEHPEANANHQKPNHPPQLRRRSRS
ncbi:hypothetical protein JAAARDRAFT_364680 [Jaapia argillacea MUCL 33604]|uniref:Uncharacterized protein n=1 Tax=Jaapia argillacea MUCL 33604 TaxID=933084 RepID=A0A067QHR1_9AGAM|nr:hypothetical protein JAAARDRAFT_364680 [Jaapia argillacea MUCL 33604]